MHFRFSAFFLFFLVVYFVLFLLYSVFSFSLTDPNLVLTSWQPYWHFQQWMWQTFFENHLLLVVSYTALVATLFVVYFALLQVGQATWLQTKKGFLLFLLIISPLFFSYNALSHDVFNYMFNAKMVVVYQANPHQKVALDFPHDEWTRFMHNTHTTAPYGYGWTAFSVLPFLLGFDKFLSTWFAFRTLSILSLLATYFALIFLSRRAHFYGNLNLAFFFFNPLVLIEIVGNSHNDLWMMATAVFALGLTMSEKKLSLKKLFLSIILLIFSISIKFSTILLLPIWLFFVMRNLHILDWVVNAFPQRQILLRCQSFLADNWPTIAATLMFLPLLTDRSQQFNPWYFTWVFVWVPFMKSAQLRFAMLILSFSSLLRYVPWLWNGSFTDQIILQQKLITWVPFIICSVLLLVFWKVKTLPNLRPRGL